MYSDIFVGSDSIREVYLGSEQLWTSEERLMLYDYGVTEYGVAAGDMADPTYNSLPYTVNSDSIIFESAEKTYNRWTSFVKTSGKVDLTNYQYFNLLCDVIIEGTATVNNLVSGGSGVGFGVSDNIYNFDTSESTFQYLQNSIKNNNSLLLPSDLSGGFLMSCYYKPINKENHIFRWDISKVNKAVQLWLCPFSLNYTATPKDQWVRLKIKRLYLSK